MGIMGCYPDKRAIENELGGKWEFFDKVTFDETAPEGIIYDKDLDGTPLRLNGVMMMIKTGATTIGDVTLYVTDNTTASTFTHGANRVSVVKSVVKNGALDTVIRSNAVLNSYGTVNSSVSLLSKMVDNISYFGLSGTFNDTTTLEFYVLRSV